MKRLDLDVVSLDRYAVLLHGAYGCGKTHLEGDFLRFEKEAGRKVAFFNLKGEDGNLTIAKMGLGATGYQIDSVADFDEAVADCIKTGVQSLAIDSLPAYSDLVRMKLFDGVIRDPDAKLDGERGRALWGILKRLTKNGVLVSRQIPHVLWVSAHDKGEDPIEGGKSITPDLVGQQARASIGWFDLVGHMRAQTKTPTLVARAVDFAPDERVATRQRLPKPILEPITIPQDQGGWAAIMAAVQERLK